MARYSKIPESVRREGAVAFGRFAIFCKGLIFAGKVVKVLYKQEKRGLPVHGYVMVEKKRVYYCMYGFVEDDDIYKS